MEATSSEDKKKQIPSTPSSGSAVNLRFKILISFTLHTTYSTTFPTLHTQPTLSWNVQYAPHVASPKALSRVQAH